VCQSRMRTGTQGKKKITHAEMGAPESAGPFNREGRGSGNGFGLFATFGRGGGTTDGGLASVLKRRKKKRGKE